MIEVWGPRSRATCKAKKGSWVGMDGSKMDPAIQGLKILSFNPLFKPLFLRILKSKTILEKPILFMVVELGGQFFESGMVEQLLLEFFFSIEQ